MISPIINIKRLHVNKKLALTIIKDTISAIKVTTKALKKVLLLQYKDYYHSNNSQC
jgi:hypothetical protein